MVLSSIYKIMPHFFRSCLKTLRLRDSLDLANKFNVSALRSIFGGQIVDHLNIWDGFCFRWTAYEDATCDDITSVMIQWNVREKNDTTEPQISMTFQKLFAELK